MDDATRQDPDELVTIVLIGTTSVAPPPKYYTFWTTTPVDRGGSAEASEAPEPEPDDL